MKTVISVILIICVCLSLYNLLFSANKGTTNFEDSYKNAMHFITDIGSVFSNLKEGIISTIEFCMSLPQKIGEFFTNFGENMKELLGNLIDRIGQFFTGLWNRIVRLFGGETSCTCENPAECTDCLCEADNCLCGDVFYPACEHPDFVGPCKNCGCYCERCARGNE